MRVEYNPASYSNFTGDNEIMLRLIFAICLLLLSGAVSYYFLLHTPEESAPKRPEISETKKAAIAKRASKQEQDLKQDQAHEESVLDLERYYK